MEFILTESEFNEDNTAWNGNRFLMGNGYFGIRGTLEEYTKKQMCAVNMAGIYDKMGNSWRESVNAPNPLYTYIKVNGKIWYPQPRDALADRTRKYYSGLREICKHRTSA